MNTPPTKSPDNTSPPDHKGSLSADLEARIEKQIEEVVPKQQRQQVVQRVLKVVRQEFFAGPIAHPSHLREYEEILPGAADRIIRMAEGNLKHQQDMDQHALSIETKDYRDGRRIGAVLVILAMALAFVAGIKGNNILAMIIFGPTAGAIIVSMIRGRAP